MNSLIRRCISALLSASIALTTMPAAAYEMPTAREQLSAELVARGVASAEAQARTAALTDEEVAQVAAQIDALPAGAGGCGPLILCAIVTLTLVAVTVVIVLPIVLVGGAVMLVAKSARKAAAAG